MGYLIFFFFLATPFMIIGFFIASLTGYLSAKKANRQNPGFTGEKEMKTLKLKMIISSVIAGTLVLVVSVFCIMLANGAISFM